MKEIADFPGYFITRSGEVWSNKYGTPYKMKPGRAGAKKAYLMVTLRKDGKQYARKIHRLVAEAFIPNPKDLPIVMHKDDNPHNNCVENLRWATQKENILDCVAKGRHVGNRKAK